MFSSFIAWLLKEIDMFNQHGKVKCAECEVVTGYKNLARHMKRKHPSIHSVRKRRDNHTGSERLYSTITNRPQVDRVGKTTGDLAHDSKKIDSIKIESESTGGNDCVGDTMNFNFTAESDDEESLNDTNSDEEDVNGDNFDLWKQFVKLSEGDRPTLFDILRCFIHIYYLLPEDDSYQEIVQDVEKACEKMDYLSALEQAIDENIDLIIHEVENANDCRHYFDIWCFISDLAEDDFESCVHEEFLYLMAIFHYMSFDDVIQSVVATVKQILDKGDAKSLTVAVKLALKKYEKVILKKVCEAQKKVSESIIPDYSSGSGIYLKPWRYSKNSH